MKRSFTIIRVSEEDQFKGYGPDVQADEVRAYLPDAKLREIDFRVIQEESTTWDRPQFESVLDEAIDLCGRGGLEAVVFPRTDRLAHKWDAFGYYLGKLRKEGLEVHFTREKTVAPDDPMQAAMLFLYGAKAHADADTIRANTTRGRRMRVERDKMMPSGGHKWAFDYHYYSRHSHEQPDANSGRYTINSERAAWIKQWAKWILEDGRSLNWCCCRMTQVEGRKWWPSTMVAILNDPAVIGKFYAYRTQSTWNPGGRRRQNLKPEQWLLVYEDPRQAILTQEQFYALQERFERNRQNSQRNGKRWYPPLRALIFCRCGRRMTGFTVRGKPRYRCIRCVHSVDAVNLWNQIRKGLKEMLLSPERLVPAVKAQLDSGQSMARLEEELASNRKRIEVIEQAEQKALRLHLYLPNHPREKLESELHRISEQRQQLEKERASLQRQLGELKQALVDKDGVRRFCEAATHNLDALDDGQWRILLETMKLRILVGEDGVPVARIFVPTVTSDKNVIVLSSS